MYIIPAIDLMGGQAVRLVKGEKEQVTVYSDNPVELALKFQNEGAKVLHIVDLDAAFGSSNNREVIRQIVDAVNMEVEVGGGIRSYDYLKSLIDSGVDRAIIGTAAFNDEEFFEEALADFADYIALSFDVKDGKVAIKGWVETVDEEPAEILKRFEAKGLQYVVYTDVSKDGMLSGPDVEGNRNLVETTNLKVIASGGVSSLDDLKTLNKIDGLYGTITGKAIYENRFTVAEAIASVA